MLSASCGFAQTTSDSSASSGTNSLFIDQLLNRDIATHGIIVLQQDKQVDNLLSKHARINKSDNKIQGWRIQIYNSSGKEARDEANEYRNKFLSKYPNLRAYLVYQPPYFKIRVGDYLTKPDAFRLYKEILTEFPVSYLVPDKINFPQF